jgi:hypothetical protein
MPPDSVPARRRDAGGPLYLSCSGVGASCLSGHCQWADSTQFYWSSQGNFAWHRKPVFKQYVVGKKGS